ncbi:P-loop containing nucleoside triphosphate hydrolase [Tanacetum coccineum]
MANLDNDHEVDKALICLLRRSVAREIHLNNLKSTPLAANRHVTTNNELPSHHETQMAITLSVNPIEAQRNVVEANIANVREGDGDNDTESTGRVDSVGLGENAKGGSSSPKDVGVPADHSMPIILEIQSDSLQQVLHTGTQNQEKQADLNPMVEVSNDGLQPLEAGQLGQIISHDPSPDSHDELSIPLYTEYLNENASQPEHDEEDPLQAEIKQLCLEKDGFIKSRKENKQRLKSKCAKEIAKMIAHIRLKYNEMDQEADAAFNCKEKEIKAKLNRLELNEALAAAFTQKCTDPTRSKNSGMQQAVISQTMTKQCLLEPTLPTMVTDVCVSPFTIVYLMELDNTILVVESQVEMP